MDCRRPCVMVLYHMSDSPVNVNMENDSLSKMNLFDSIYVCNHIGVLAAALVTHADPEPHKNHHPLYYYYYSQRHSVKSLEGDGVARHPGGSTSFVAPQVHGLSKRSADPTPESNPEPAADPDSANIYSYQVVHHGHPHYGYNHGYRYPYNAYRYNHYYGYPHRYHSHYKRSVEPEPEPEPYYTYHERPHYYNRYYHSYNNYYPSYPGYRCH
ncbi:histidine-rich glycoprotein-like [Penaeus monodon]|uniref:histidine-rich glycoprotein-like n=1 Tax=Penaeus monodon TaxID=6687 RepID=UPI0018A75E2D|nr:histidine-rich glycoprotein-like [Penaeus monodon]